MEFNMKKITSFLLLMIGWFVFSQKCNYQTFTNAKDFTLKPNKTYIYDVNIKSDFEVLQGDRFFDTFNDRKYRFKISFPLESYSQCGESNQLITDWIYKN